MDKKKKILFIINPTSGIGRQKLVEAKIQRWLDRTKFDYEVAYTEYAHHGIAIAKEASGKGVDLIVSVGGDGSANEIAQAIVNTKTAMGIIPVGSGNGLAHCLKIPSGIAGAIRVLNAYKIKKIDTVTLNDKMFASMAGIGYDAQVAETFAGSKLRGFLSYARIMISEYIKHKSEEYIVDFEGRQIKKHALMISFANSDQYGYNARISPKSLLDDGYVDIIIIHRKVFGMALSVIPRLFMGNAHKSKYVEIHRVKEAVIKCEQAVACHIDGDANTRITEAIIKVQPLSLNVIVP